MLSNLFYAPSSTDGLKSQLISYEEIFLKRFDFLNDGDSRIWAATKHKLTRVMGWSPL